MRAGPCGRYNRTKARRSCQAHFFDSRKNISHVISMVSWMAGVQHCRHRATTPQHSPAMRPAHESDSIDCPQPVHRHANRVPVH